MILLSNLKLPDSDGIMLLEWLKEKYKSIPIIIMTGYWEALTAVCAIKMGVFDFLEKPINPSLLSAKIKSVFESIRSEGSVENNIPDREALQFSNDRILKSIEGVLNRSENIFEDKTGSFRDAKGGTIFLDEVSNFQGNYYYVYFSQKNQDCHISHDAKA